MVPLHGAFSTATRQTGLHHLHGRGLLSRRHRLNNVPGRHPSDHRPRGVAAAIREDPCCSLPGHRNLYSPDFAIADSAGGASSRLPVRDAAAAGVVRDVIIADGAGTITAAVGGIPVRHGATAAATNAATTAAAGGMAAVVVVAAVSPGD